MFRKKVKICKICGEVNHRKAEFCRCCRENLDADTYKVKKNIRTKEDFGEQNYIKFNIVNGDSKRKITINDSFFIERSEQDKLFDNVYLSGKHAMVFVKDHKLYVRDLGSTNGTFIGDKRLVLAKDYPVKHKDTVKFANVAFEVQVEIEVK